MNRPIRLSLWRFVVCAQITAMNACLPQCSTSSIWPEATPTSVDCQANVRADTVISVDGLNDFFFSLDGPDENQRLWYRTQDSGATYTRTWKGFTATDGSLIDYAYLHLDPSEDADRKYGLVRSTDGGETWTLVDGAPFVSQLLQDKDNELYLISEQQNVLTLYRSDDGGLTWIWLTPPDFLHIVLGEGVLYAFGSRQRTNGLFLSRDSGASWSDVLANNDSGAPVDTPMAVVAGDGGHVAFLPSLGIPGIPPCDQNFGLWRSADYGETWVNDLWFGADTDTPCTAGRPDEMVLGPDDQLWLLWPKTNAGTSAVSYIDREIWTTTDWGDNWTYLKPTYKGWAPPEAEVLGRHAVASTSGGLVYQIRIEPDQDRLSTVWCSIGRSETGSFRGITSQTSHDVASGEIARILRVTDDNVFKNVLITRDGQPYVGVGPRIYTGLLDQAPWWDSQIDTARVTAILETDDTPGHIWVAMTDFASSGKLLWRVDRSNGEANKTFTVLPTFLWLYSHETYQVGGGLQMDHRQQFWTTAILDTDYYTFPARSYSSTSFGPDEDAASNQRLPYFISFSRYNDEFWYVTQDPMTHQTWLNQSTQATWDEVDPCAEFIEGPHCLRSPAGWDTPVIDSQGRLYMRDTVRGAVIRHDPADGGHWQTVADGFMGPDSILIDPNDPEKIWVVDGDLYVMRPQDGVVIRRHD